MQARSRLRHSEHPIGRRAALQRLAAAGVVFATIPVTRSARAADDLVVMDFAGYEVPELHQAYVKKYGGSPPVSFYADGDEAFTKVRGGFRADLVHPGSFDAPRFREAGLLQPWDTSRLSNWPDVIPSLASTPGAVADGKQWMIPCDWGVDSILYRTDMVEPGEESWSLLWDKKHAGKLSYGTELYPAIAGAALALGIATPFSATDEEFQRIRAKLAEQKPLIRFYWSDTTEFEQAIASGEVVAGASWSSSYATLKGQGVPVKWMQPKEGTIAWVSGFLRLKDAPGKEQNAYDYVDAWLAPESGRWIIENYGYAHSNRKAFEGISEDVLKEKGLSSDPEAIIAHSLMNTAMSEDLHARYAQMFEEVRAGF